MASTHLPDGVTNVAESVALGSYVAPDPTKCHTWFSDFDQYNAGLTTTPGEWLPTITGSGTATITDEDGGILLLTNDTNEDDAYWTQWKGWNSNVAETFTWTANKALWFKCRFKVSEATQSDLQIGLVVTDTTPIDAADGIFFVKVDGSAEVNFKAIKTGASNTTATVATLADDTYVTLGFAYLPFGDGVVSSEAICKLYVDDAYVGSVSTFTNFPSTELAVSFGYQNGSAGAKTMSLDYIVVSKQRD